MVPHKKLVILTDMRFFNSVLCKRRDLCFEGEFKLPIDKVKTAYDCISLVISVLLSFLFFGFGVFSGIGWGTLICSLTNGWLIDKLSKWLGSKFDFKDALKLRNKIV